ncbi:MAG: hypothetical protein ACYS9X_22950, partial [Planctomycetota bacterium]
MPTLTDAAPRRGRTGRLWTLAAVLVSALLSSALLSSALLSPAPAAGQEVDVDRIILTAPKFDPAGRPLGGPVTFRCDEFELRFSAKAKPVSLKRLADGKELIHQGNVSEGFYLNSFKGRI